METPFLSTFMYNKHSEKRIKRIGGAVLELYTLTHKYIPLCFDRIELFSKNCSEAQSETFFWHILYDGDRKVQQKIPWKTAKTLFNWSLVRVNINRI